MAEVQQSDVVNVDWQSTKKTVSDRNRHMFNNPEISDISFTCERSERTFYAHKYVLATSSAVFKAMFYGDLAEKNSVLHLSDTDEKSLEEFLRFLYTDECNLTTDNIISVMYLSKKYLVPSLTLYVKVQLVRSMDPGNVLEILEQAIHFQEKDLEWKCWNIIEWRTSEVVSSENFINIKQTTLASLLKRNRLDVTEVQLFQAVLKWIDHQCSQKGLELTTENRRSVIGDAVYDLRFIAMNQQEFAKHVSQSGLLTAEELVPIYETFNNLQPPLLRWGLPKRELETFTPSKEEIRISRFPGLSKNDCFFNSWQYCNQPPDKGDYLSFSVDQCALFLGVRFFGASKDRSGMSQYPDQYSVELSINGKRTDHSGVRYVPQENKKGISGFDLMLQSPILLKKNEVVKMGATISGLPSIFGWRGKPVVRVQGVTVKFYDPDICSSRTCVSRGQFHEIILSI